MKYNHRTKKELSKWLSSKKSYLKNNNTNVEISFDIDSLWSWYQKLEKVCFYCGLSEEEQFNLINRNVVNSSRFFSSAKGKRGRHLEIDRKNPNGDYSESNCVLCCYFCNNDKSNVFHADQYFEFANPTERARQLRKLLKK